MIVRPYDEAAPDSAPQPEPSPEPAPAGPFLTFTPFRAVKLDHSQELRIDIAQKGDSVSVSCRLRQSRGKGRSMKPEHPMHVFPEHLTAVIAALTEAGRAIGAHPNAEDRTMLTPDDMAAATAGPGPVDLAALRRALDACVLYPSGEGLSGFAESDHTLTEMTDDVCPHLAGDYTPLPEPALAACLDYTAAYPATLHGHSYMHAAAMAVRNWHGFRERFAANAPA